MSFCPIDCSMYSIICHLGSKKPDNLTPLGRFASSSIYDKHLLGEINQFMARPNIRGNYNCASFGSKKVYAGGDHGIDVFSLTGRYLGNMIGNYKIEEIVCDESVIYCRTPLSVVKITSEGRFLFSFKTFVDIQSVAICFDRVIISTKLHLYVYRSDGYLLHQSEISMPGPQKLAFNSRENELYFSLQERKIVVFSYEKGFQMVFNTESKDRSNPAPIGYYSDEILVADVENKKLLLYNRIGVFLRSIEISVRPDFINANQRTGQIAVLDLSDPIIRFIQWPLK